MGSSSVSYDWICCYTLHYCALYDVGKKAVNPLGDIGVKMS